jgi:hypothetical protein
MTNVVKVMKVHVLTYANDVKGRRKDWEKKTEKIVRLDTISQVTCM